MSTKTNKSFSEYFSFFIKGILIGIADVIPGVSGGTIALITGIYERLITGINDIFSLINKKNLTNLFKLKFSKLGKEIEKIDFKFFIPLGIGIIAAIILFSNIMHYLLENKVNQTYSTFIGLIIASVFILGRDINFKKIQNWIFIILGFIAGFLIVGLTSINATQSVFLTFISGAIAITTMILPGISGSFMLVVLNQYEYIINAIKNFDIGVIAIFGLGAFIGLLLFTRFLNYLIKNHKIKTISFLTGLMAGSIKLMISKIVLINCNLFEIVEVNGFIVIGMIIVLIMNKLDSKKLQS